MLAISLLVGAARLASAAPEPAPRKERIEELWIDAKGESGRILTSPMYLDDAPGEYHFGPAFCRRGHRLGTETLRALQGALASGQPVRVDAKPDAASGTERQCVTGVALYPPLP